MELKIADLINFMSSWDTTVELRQLGAIWKSVDTAIEHGIVEAFKQAEESWKTEGYHWKVSAYIHDMYAMQQNPNTATILRVVYMHINDIPEEHHAKLIKKVLDMVKEG